MLCQRCKMTLPLLKLQVEVNDSLLFKSSFYIFKLIFTFKRRIGVDILPPPGSPPHNNIFLFSSTCATFLRSRNAAVGMQARRGIDCLLFHPNCERHLLSLAFWGKNPRCTHALLRKLSRSRAMGIGRQAMEL